VAEQDRLAGKGALKPMAKKGKHWVKKVKDSKSPNKEISLRDIDMQSGIKTSSGTDLPMNESKVCESPLGPLVFRGGQWREMDLQGRDITYADVEEATLFNKIREETDFGYENSTPRGRLDPKRAAEIKKRKWEILDFEKFDTEEGERYALERYSEILERRLLSKTADGEFPLGKKDPDPLGNVQEISDINIDGVDPDNLPIVATKENLERIRGWGKQAYNLNNQEVEPPHQSRRT
jgi:hypothetical protein